jgi:magnesium-transporting ATPase (P-type)
LGAEPPAAHVLDRPPARRHLLDRPLFTRAFGLLGPVEALVSMAAFVATFLAAGWRPGEGFPGGTTLAAASGAAFTAIVLGQAANAVACRSTVRPAWRTGLRGNRLLPAAVTAEVAMLVGFLYVAPLADILGHRGPGLVGWLIAGLAVPAVLVADGLRKTSLRESRHPDAG